MPESPQGALQVQWKVGPGGSVGVLYAWWTSVLLPNPGNVGFSEDVILHGKWTGGRFPKSKTSFSFFPLFLKHIVSLYTQVLFRWFWIQCVIWRPQMRCFHRWEDQYELRKERKKAFGLLPLLSTMCFRLNRDG